MNNDPLKQAVEMARAGDKAGACFLLRQIVATDSNNENAWGWLAFCAETKLERRQALERVLEINPENRGARGELEKLGPAPTPTPVRQPVPIQPQPSPKIDSYLLEQEITRLTGKGWQVVDRTQTSAQMRKPKQWNRFLLVVGIITLCVGFGLIVLIVALVDYLFKRDQLIYVTADGIRSDLERKSRIPKMRPLTFWDFVLFGLVLLFILSLVALVILQGRA